MCRASRRTMAASVLLSGRDVADANVVFSPAHEDGDRRLFADVDDAGQLPLFGIEGKGQQLVPAVAGDGPAKAEGFVVLVF